MIESASYIEPDWDAPASVRAAVTTRLGGVSQSPWQSFNLATHVGDVEKHVSENRSRLRRDLSLPAEPLWLEQVHGVNVVDVASAEQGAEADAAIALVPGQVCVVMTADCLPVLFCEPKGRRVAAAHAGWRGLLNGVLEATVEKMRGAAGELMAWLGPAIGPAQFEVGSEVRDAYLRNDEESSRAFRASGKEGHYYADLYELARIRLFRQGVKSVSGGGFCTYTDSERFYSYRRDGQCGRMASLIWLDDEG